MRKEMIGGLGWAAGMIAVAFAASFAHKLGYIEQDTARRASAFVIGLWLAWYGNRMPKALAPSACARQVRRVGGWTLALSGLAYAGLWAFAPMPTAMTVGTGVVLGGMAVMIGYCLTLRVRARAA